MKINIDKEEYSSTKWFNGTYIDREGQEWPFIIVVDYDDNSSSCRVDEVQWVDSAPCNYDAGNEQIESQIRDEFYARQ